MVTIISLCKYKLSEEEYVRPLVEILGGKVIHYKDNIIPEDNIVVLSGTAIKDFEYLNYIDKIKEKIEGKKVIGICAGAQVIALINGGRLINREFIGVYNIKYKDKYVRAFFLITKYPIVNGEYLAYIENLPAIFKINNMIGITFHPEVLNKDILIELVYG